MKRLITLIAIPTLVATAVSTASLPTNGVEIGNGKVDEQGGFEIGNGSFENDVYRLKQILGRWQVEWMKKYAEFTAVGTDSLKTRAEIDLEKDLSILSLEDLVNSVPTGRWTPTHIGNAYGVRTIPTASMSGRMQVKYRLFRAPGEIIAITVAGPGESPANEAFLNFVKALESIEVVKK